MWIVRTARETTEIIILKNQFVRELSESVNNHIASIIWEHGTENLKDLYTSKKWVLAKEIKKATKMEVKKVLKHMNSSWITLEEMREIVQFLDESKHQEWTISDDTRKKRKRIMEMRNRVMQATMTSIGLKSTAKPNNGWIVVSFTPILK